MKILELIQGSDLWLLTRASYFTASEAPAMLGLSKYQTRNALIQAKSAGITPEIDAGTQRRFDAGHMAEAQARPLAEAIIEQDLYPVTATLEVEGLPLLASFDGISMDEEIIFEHKLFNKALACAIEDHKSGIIDRLEPHYTAQINQQLLVSGAKKCLFMTSDGTVENMSWCWYKPNPAEIQIILGGWKQFEKDLENYIPPVVVEMPKAEVTIELPALFIHAHGGITTSNMAEYGAALALKLAEVRSIALITDQDFSNAKEAAKIFREQCQKLKLAKDAMLSQTMSVGEAARMIDAWSEDLRVTALQLEKDVEREDLAKKTAMVDAARMVFNEYFTELEAGIKPVRLIAQHPNFGGALKGKRNYASMQDAVDTALANGKIEVGAVEKDIREKLDWFNSSNSEYHVLFPDIQAIIYKQADDFRLLVDSRINAHKQAQTEKIEAERENIRAEEEAKARAKIEEEERVKADEAKAQKAREDLEAEKLARQEADKAKQSAPEPEPEATATSGNRPAVMSAPALRAVVVEHQDEVRDFLNTLNVSDEKKNTIRAYLMEFVKYQAAMKLEAAA